MYLRLPEGTREAVLAGSGPLTVNAVEYGDDHRPTGGVVPTVVFLDGDVVRSAPEADAPALIAALQTDRQAALQLRNQVLIDLDPLTGQLASTLLTNAQAQAFLKALVYESGGIDPRTGRYHDPREWIKR